MNKKLCALFTAGMLASSGYAVFADELPSLVAPSVSCTLDVNNQIIALESYSIYEKSDQIMVPVRAVSEQLGFTVEWSSDDRSVTLDNGNVNTKLYIGMDSYYRASSTSLGMTKPIKYNAAPEIINNTTYVPVEMFNLMLSEDPQAVNIDKTNENNIIISINTEEEPVEEPFDDNTQLPNPIKNYATVNEAVDTLSFDPSVPVQVPEAYSIKSINTIDGKILQIIYIGGHEKVVGELTFRTAKGNNDISGDFNVYNEKKTIKIDDIDIKAKGNNGKIYNAIWTEYDTVYTITSEKGITSDELKIIIESIKPVLAD
ncbi:MAG: DUF4367 domain-containing protein [Firmicutes bacterium]|nr:DUF4367 domain-containing protein [Bacillota bacterium]